MAEKSSDAWELFQARVKPLANDNTSGAQALAIKACQSLLDVVSKRNMNIDNLTLLTHLAKFGRLLVKNHPTNAALRQMMKRIIRLAEELPQGSSAKEALIPSLKNLIAHLSSITSRIASHASLLIANEHTLLTHSLSTTVFEAMRLSKSQGKTFRVLVTESPPVFEGRLMSQLLNQIDIQVTLIVDSAINSLERNIDAVFIGADRLTDAEFINRIGTRGIVETAKRLAIPCYLLAGSDKFLPENEEPLQLSHGNTAKGWNDPPESIDIMTPHFDRTPLRLLTAIISEQGLTTYEDYSLRKGNYFRALPYYYRED